MSTITPIYSESNLVGNLTTAITSTDTTIYVEFRDKITGNARIPQSSTKLFVIDKGDVNQPNPNYEIIICASHSTSGGVTTLTGCTRGLVFYGTSTGAGTGNAHIARAEVGCVDVHYYSNILASILDGTNSAPAMKIGVVPTFELVGILADRVFADATARDTAITAPSNGMSCYLTAEGYATDYIGGSWQARASGVNPNASETVAGKVEIATQTENDTGTSTGTTGALLSATPDKNAKSIQENKWVYAEDGEASDAYKITITPAISGYVTGQIFYFKANTANTGACSLNVNNKGAITIKRFHDQDMETGDIESGQIVGVQYDGTNFQMLTPISSQMSTANSNILTGGTASNADTLHTHITSYASIETSVNKGTSTENIDTTITCGFRPNIIQIEYKLIGLDNGTEKFSEGIATFNETTFKSVLVFLDNSSAGNITEATIRTNLYVGAGIIAGSSGGGNGFSVTMTVNSVTDTTCVVRLAYTIVGTPAGAKISTFNVKCFA